MTTKKLVFPRSDDPCAQEANSRADFRNKLPDIVNKLVGTCYENNCFEHIDASPLPSRQSAIDLLEISKEILFPGYFRIQGIDSVNLNYRLGLEISELYDKLANEIAASIRHECIRYDQPCLHCDEMGNRKSYEFIESLPNMRKVLATDVRAAYDGDPAARSFDEIIFSYPGIFAILTYRIAHRLYELEVPILPRIMSEYAHSVTGIDIHPGAEIGESFFIDHGTGVVIGQTSTIGNRVKLYQGVTLGALSFKRDESGDLDRHSKRHPTLEDDVTVYAGTTILGGETTIGARSVIGGNIWLTQSIPQDTKVLLNPPELILKSK